MPLVISYYVYLMEIARTFDFYMLSEEFFENKDLKIIFNLEKRIMYKSLTESINILIYIIKVFNIF